MNRINLRKGAGSYSGVANLFGARVRIELHPDGVVEVYDISNFTQDPIAVGTAQRFASDNERAPDARVTLKTDDGQLAYMAIWANISAYGTRYYGCEIREVTLGDVVFA